MQVDQKSFREAMARLGAAVNVITSNGPTGRCGFTASAVCSVTDDPPTLLVCMRRAGDLNGQFKENGVLCVNILAGSHQEISNSFASQSQAKNDVEARFAKASWETLVTGSPALSDALVALDCRIANIVEVGTHSVLFCEVQAVKLGEEAPALIYYKRGYHGVGA